MKHCRVHACLHARAGNPESSPLQPRFIDKWERTRRISNIQGTQFHLPTTLKKR